MPFIAILRAFLFNFEPAALTVCCFAGLAGLFFYKIISKSGRKTAYLLSGLFLSLFFVALCVCGKYLSVEPSWDFGRVYAGAKDIFENGKLTYTLEYFLESNNNFFTAFLLSGYYKVARLFNLTEFFDFGTLGIMLNIFAIFLSRIFRVSVANILRGARDAAFRAFLFLIFTPLWTYAPIFYTDTLSMPFVSLLVLVFSALYKYRDKISAGVSVLLCLCGGASLFMGLKLKPTVGIVFIARLILSLVNRKGTKQRLLIFFSAAVMLFSYGVFEDHGGVIDKTDIDLYRLPPEHYVMMGLAGNGGYNEEDHFATLAIEDIEERKAACVGKIKSRISDYGPVGFCRFLCGKINYTWLDGSYFASKKLAIDPNFHTVLSDVFTDGGKYNGYCLIFQTGLQILLLISMAVRAAKGDDLGGELSLCVAGLFLFLLVWETRSRYLVNFIPVFILLSVCGFRNISLFVNKKILQ